MCVERKRANHTAGWADLSVVSSCCIYFSNSYKKWRVFKAVIPNCSLHKPQTAALCAGKCLEGRSLPSGLFGCFTAVLWPWGWSDFLGDPIHRWAGQAALWSWRMTLVCCPKCCCGRKNVTMGDLHILTFRGAFRHPHVSLQTLPAFGALLIHGDRSGQPRGSMPGAGEEESLPARGAELPLTLWGSTGVLGWDCADTSSCSWSFK